MFNVVLFEPEIAPNTGNIIRLCANCGSRLHLVGKLGFDWDDKKLRRAGLDYAEWTSVKHWDNYTQFSDLCLGQSPASTLYAFTTKATQRHSDAQFKSGDFLLFGPETRGLPGEILDKLSQQHKVRLPMVAQSRSLNLSNCVAVAIYEAWRQLEFAGSI